MVVDDDILEKEDMYILDHMKDFISGEDVVKYGAAKQLLILIERAVRVLLSHILDVALTVDPATRWRHQGQDDYQYYTATSTCSNQSERLKKTQAVGH
jgi:hypothetical protein